MVLLVSLRFGFLVGYLLVFGIENLFVYLHSCEEVYCCVMCVIVCELSVMVVMVLFLVVGLLAHDVRKELVGLCTFELSLMRASCCLQLKQKSFFRPRRKAVR